jgi:hypothetical protein
MLDSLSGEIDNTNCISCAIGRYQSSTHRTHTSAEQASGDVCTICATGTYVAYEGARICANCGSGKYMTSGLVGQTSGTVCLPCDAGYEQPNTGVSGTSMVDACTICSAGEYAHETGTSNCRQCAAGKYMVTSTGSITSDDCLDCTSPNFTSNAAAHGTDMADGCFCEQGYFRDGDYCKECFGGQYKADQGDHDCDLCAAGKYTLTTTTGSLDSSVCINCPAGRYSDVAGYVFCSTVLPPFLFVMSLCLSFIHLLLPVYILLTPHGTSLIVIPPSINQSIINRHNTHLLITIQVRMGRLRRRPVHYM